MHACTPLSTLILSHPSIRLARTPRAPTGQRRRAHSRSTALSLFLSLQLPGKRGWWSAPLAIRAAHLGVGAAVGARQTSAFLTLDAPALARLMRPSAPALRLSPGASLSVSCPCAGGAASRDDSFEFGLAAADYRVPGKRGLMLDYSLGVTLLSRASPAASRALLGGGDAASAAPPSGAAVLSGGVPTPAALRPLCRALNQAAHLADRPAAPWP